MGVKQHGAFIVKKCPGPGGRNWLDTITPLGLSFIRQSFLRLLLRILFFIMLIWGGGALYGAMMSGSASWVQWAFGAGLLIGATVINQVWFRPK